MVIGDNIEIRLYALSSSIGFPGLGIGVILEVFHVPGMNKDENEKIRISRLCHHVFFTINGEMLSSLVALLPSAHSQW